MGELLDTEPTVVKNVVGAIGLVVVSLGLAGAIYGVHSSPAFEGESTWILVAGSTLLGLLGAGVLWVTERDAGEANTDEDHPGSE
jgi:hypothetical protein